MKKSSKIVVKDVRPIRVRDNQGLESALREHDPRTDKVPNGSVASEIECLSAVVAELEKQTSALAQSLDPILRLDGPSNPVPGIEEPSCRVAFAVQGIRVRVSGIRDTLENLYQRLAIE